MQGFRILPHSITSDVAFEAFGKTNVELFKNMADEAGAAYKNIHDIVEALSLSEISLPVASFKPIGNIKG